MPSRSSPGATRASAARARSPSPATGSTSGSPGTRTRPTWTRPSAELEGQGVRVAHRRADFTSARRRRRHRRARGRAGRPRRARGQRRRGPLHAVPRADAETFQRVLALTLVGPFLCGQRAARRMVEQGRGGRIVNVTSVHEHVPLKGAAGYTAGKHGLGGLTKLMALESPARHHRQCRRAGRDRDQDDRQRGRRPARRGAQRASPPAAPATPTRSPPPSPSCARPRRATSPAPPTSSTAACC